MAKLREQLGSTEAVDRKLKGELAKLEEGCGKFSNLDGLTHIGFPNGQISAAFDEIRRVLEREGLVSAAKPTA